MLYRMLYWANLHVGLVIIPNLLDVNVIEGIHVELGGGVTPTHAHHPRYILEVVVVRNSDLHVNTRNSLGLVIKQFCRKCLWVSCQNII